MTMEFFCKDGHAVIRNYPMAVVTGQPYAGEARRAMRSSRSQRVWCAAPEGAV